MQIEKYMFFTKSLIPKETNQTQSHLSEPIVLGFGKTYGTHEPEFKTIPGIKYSRVTVQDIIDILTTKLGLTEADALNITVEDSFGIEVHYNSTYTKTDFDSVFEKA